MKGGKKKGKEERKGRNEGSNGRKGRKEGVCIWEKSSNFLSVDVFNEIVI